MLIPTLPVEIWRQVGLDAYAQPRFVKIGTPKAAPVKLIFTNQHSTVRTDSAASHGHASETVANVVLLFLPSVDLKPEDMIVLLGRKVRVREIHPRFTVKGKHDHNQVGCEAWV